MKKRLYENIGAIIEYLENDEFCWDMNLALDALRKLHGEVNDQNLKDEILSERGRIEGLIQDHKRKHTIELQMADNWRRYRSIICRRKSQQAE